MNRARDKGYTRDDKVSLHTVLTVLQAESIRTIYRSINLFLIIINITILYLYLYLYLVLAYIKNIKIVLILHFIIIINPYNNNTFFSYISWLY